MSQLSRRLLLQSAACTGASYFAFNLSARAQDHVLVTPQDVVYSSTESAPPDAYLPGNPHPYYGSENPWDRRFFDKNDGSQAIYDRRETGLMLDIVEGRLDDAETHARKLLAETPDDLEAVFILAVVAAARGDLEGAIEHARTCVGEGMPPERFIAGPREILAPVVALPSFVELCGGALPSLVHGPLLGQMTTGGFAVWVRTREESEVQLRVSASPDMSSPGSSAIRTSAERDFTAVIPIGGLAPGTTYYYDLLIDGVGVLDEPKQIRTLPAEDSSETVVIGFGGCAGYAPWNERMWDQIAGDRLHYMLMMGDNVYISLPGPPNAVHDYTYYRRQSRPEFRRFASITPIVAVWDDHDAGMDDCWLGPFADRPAWKQPMVRHFQNQWCNGPTGQPDWPGHWSRKRVGAVDMFVLDGRTYRTNPFDENPTMLGPQQKRWLLDGLAASTAPFKIIASPVAWGDIAKAGTRDGWSGFPDERAEIFDFIRDRGVSGVILLSSDRHRADVWLHQHPGLYPLHEFASALLTHDYVHELKPEAEFSYNARPNYGRLTFEAGGADPSVRGEIVTIDGDVVFTTSIRLGDLVV